MSNTQHTPGPWAMPDSGQGRISKVGANGGWDGLIATADCGDYARSRSEGLANARLIAAAPDLLEAIQAVIAANASEGKAPGGFSLQGPTREHQRRVHLAWQKVHAAIAKATGGAV